MGFRERVRGKERGEIGRRDEGGRGFGKEEEGN